LAVVEGALAAPYAAKVESDHGKVAVREGIVELVDDLMVHRPAELRVRMQYDCDRRVFLRRRMIPAFDPAGRTGENDLGHAYQNLDRRATGGESPEPGLSALDGIDGRT
jgi:hypothetical protein